MNRKVRTSWFLYFSVTLLGAISFFIFTPSVRADTIVSDPIESDTTWNIAGSPYILGMAFVRGATLTIDPGVTVQFADNSSGITILNGKLEVNGTADAPVSFVGSQMGSIQFYNSVGSYIHHASINGTFYGVGMDSSTVSFEDVSMADNMEGITASGSNLTLSNFS